MTYNARRIRPGLYEYRLHIIERLDASEGERPPWTITPEGERHPVDSAKSLRDAKRRVNQLTNGTIENDRTPIWNRVWTVYGIYNGEQLLYVGISSQYKRRQREHMAGECQTTRQTLYELRTAGIEITFRSLDEIQGNRRAIAAETELRRTLQPALNALPPKEPTT